MKVTVDGREVDLFSGAKVRDALLHASPQTLDAVEKGGKKVYDRWGNEVGLDGALSDGQQLQVR